MADEQGIARLRGRLRATGEPPAGRLSARLRTAAVAVPLRESDAGLEVLFIRRPHRHGDRWSGDVAFPGGLGEPGDADPEVTARREAREEVDLELGAALGRLPTQLTAEPRRLRPMRIVPVVFEVPGGAEPRPSPAEVAEAFWFPLRELAARRPRLVDRRLGRLRLPFPAVDLDGRVLWGLTLRMVQDLLRRAQ